METILVSTLVVATAEFGDKTQLLAILLAARFRAPVPIMLGILGATLVNHALAAALRLVRFGDCLSGDTLRWILAVSFTAMAIWMLLPDKLDKPPRRSTGWARSAQPSFPSSSSRSATRRKLATIALAAHYQSVFWSRSGRRSA